VSPVSPSTDAATTTKTPDPRRWKALGVLSLAQFIVILDTSIIGVALPTIQQHFSFSQADLQWIFNAYVIVFGALLLLGGRLSDIVGQKKIFIIGFVTLTIASVIAGLAPSGIVLILARVLQGIGAALIAPSALSIVMALFGSNKLEMNKAMGIWFSTSRGNSWRLPGRNYNCMDRLVMGIPYQCARWYCSTGLNTKTVASRRQTKR
jgi:MFS family permease